MIKLIRTFSEAKGNAAIGKNQLTKPVPTPKVSCSQQESNFSGNAFLTNDHVRASATLAKNAQAITAW